MSQREAALAAFFSAISGIAGVTVERNRDRPPEVGELPFLVQFDGGHVVARPETETDNYTLTVEVEITVTAATPAALGPALNTLWADLVKAATASPTLGDVVQEVRHRSLGDPEVLQDENEIPVMSATASFDVDFATLEDDPFTAP